MQFVKFTKASKSDKYLVTVSLKALEKTVQADFANGEWADLAALVKGDIFILEVGGVNTCFKVNRSGKTATTKAFPRHLRLPNVGRPTTAYVAHGATVLN